MPVTRLADFDTWRPGYAGATLTVYRAGSTTLADLFLNEAMTVPADNPQVLLTLVEDQQSYGKLRAPCYVAQAFTINIDNIDTTGTIRPPLTTLDNENADDAVVTPQGAIQATSLAIHLSRTIYAQDFGDFLETGETGASSATNNATLVTAIGAAGAQGGGVVRLPPGTFDFLDFVIPEGVVVEGEGDGATFLVSTEATPIVSLGGIRCGMAGLTVDGVSQEANSVGLFAVAADETIFENVVFKRFESGLYLRGGERGDWRSLSVSDCVSGAKLHGDLNAGAGGGGEAFLSNRWVGGRVELCSTVGIEMKRVDATCGFSIFENISFIDNTGTAYRQEGARSVMLINPTFDGNTINTDIKDGTPVSSSNTVVGFTQRGGRFQGGEIRLSGTLENVIFDGAELADVDIVLTSPLNNVISLDCREDAATTVTGAATHWLRRKTTDAGSSFGLTTGNAATKAWAIALESGQMVLIEAKVLGRQRNGVNRASYWFANTGRRAAATLAYDTQTGNFTVGNILTGQTSGATARIIADADGGTSGTLSLHDVTGVFVDNEIITDGATGSATANGAVTPGAVSVGTQAVVRTGEATDGSWSVAIVANGPEIELRVTGATGQTVEWTAEVIVTST